MLEKEGAIGIFDSGFGGLTVLKSFHNILPEYDYIYLGDNLRAPYGSLSQELIYIYTLQAVKTLFALGCNLVILACNTASTKALRRIQQNDLAVINPSKRVLGVVRPTAEIIGEVSQTKHIGILGTESTIYSDSYNVEIHRLYPDYAITCHACPMWVPLIENMETESDKADFFVEKYTSEIMSKDSEIDTLILACTHYPLLLNKIRKFVPERVKIVAQGEYIAQSLKNYLYAHPEIDKFCSKNNNIQYFTTGNIETFNKAASNFLGCQISAKKITITSV